MKSLIFNSFLLSLPHKCTDGNSVVRSIQRSVNVCAHPYLSSFLQALLSAPLQGPSERSRRLLLEGSTEARHLTNAWLTVSSPQVPLAGSHGPRQKAEPRRGREGACQASSSAATRPEAATAPPPHRAPLPSANPHPSCSSSRRFLLISTPSPPGLAEPAAAA